MLGSGRASWCVTAPEGCHRVSRGLIAEAVLNQIKERLDIVDVISGHLTLIRAGNNFKARCPFHNERSPSFTVSPSKQLFHCFGCGASGDALTFYMKVSGLVFPEAVRELGRRVGIDVPESGGPEADREAQLRRRLEQVNDAAQGFFRDCLQDPGVGRIGREYLAMRGIEQPTIERFGIGLAPNDWERLVRAVKARGFTDAELVHAGLAIQRVQRPAAESETRQAVGTRTASGVYANFRNRVMFPISDLRRRVVAFGGRALGDETPKYLNSKETPLFHKGRTLYALDAAHEAAGRADQVIIVEGYFDAVALHQAGIGNVVATLGTALTDEHVRLLRRYVKQVVLLFDPDAAGVRAALKSLELFVDTGLRVTVMSVPEGDDPDTFVRAQGAVAFRELLDRSPSLWDFALEQSLAPAASGRVEDKVRCADAVLQIIQKIQHPLERAERLRRVAERLGMKESLLNERLRSNQTAQASAPASPRGAASSAAAQAARQRNTTAPAGRPAARSTAGRRVDSPYEREMVHLVLQGLLTAAEAAELSPSLFSTAVYRTIIETALQHRGSDGRILMRPTLEALLGNAGDESTESSASDAADQEVAAVVTELSVLERQDDDVRASVRGCLASLTRRRRELQLADCVRELKIASQAGRLDEVAVLNARVNELRMEKAGECRVPQ